MGQQRPTFSKLVVIPPRTQNYSQSVGRCNSHTPHSLLTLVNVIFFRRCIHLIDTFQSWMQKLIPRETARLLFMRHSILSINTLVKNTVSTLERNKNDKRRKMMCSTWERGLTRPEVDVGKKIATTTCMLYCA